MIKSICDGHAVQLQRWLALMRLHLAEASLKGASVFRLFPRVVPLARHPPSSD